MRSDYESVWMCEILHWGAWLEIPLGPHLLYLAVVLRLVTQQGSKEMKRYIPDTDRFPKGDLVLARRGSSSAVSWASLCSPDTKLVIGIGSCVSGAVELVSVDW